MTTAAAAAASAATNDAPSSQCTIGFRQQELRTNSNFAPLTAILSQTSRHISLIIYLVVVVFCITGASWYGVTKAILFFSDFKQYLVSESVSPNEINCISDKKNRAFLMYISKCLQTNSWAEFFFSHEVVGFDDSIYEHITQYPNEILFRNIY